MRRLRGRSTPCSTEGKRHHGHLIPAGTGQKRYQSVMVSGRRTGPAVTLPTREELARILRRAGPRMRTSKAGSWRPSARCRFLAPEVPGVVDICWRIEYIKRLFI